MILIISQFGGLAPGPFAGLILADNGATVIRVDKPDSTNIDVLHRGKRSIAINPKVTSGREALLKLISSADVLIDPFRPGVLERLGLGPEVFLGNAQHKGLNPRLIYGRVVGCVILFLMTFCLSIDYIHVGSPGQVQPSLAMLNNLIDCGQVPIKIWQVRHSM